MFIVLAVFSAAEARADEPAGQVARTVSTAAAVSGAASTLTTSAAGPVAPKPRFWKDWWTRASAGALIARHPDRLRAQATGQETRRERERPAWRAVVGAALGGTAGFFGGAYLGAAIEGDGCHCDDPGLKGALIGAPIGAGVGAVIGGLYF